MRTKHLPVSGEKIRAEKGPVARIFALRAIAGLAMCAAAGIANGTVIADLEDATNGGGFFSKVTFEDTAANVVKVTADIADPINVGLTQGDILGLWLDIADESFLAGLTFTNETPSGIITSSIIDANNVGSSLGGNVNLNGTDETNFDMGLELGFNGGPEFVQTIMFDMTSPGLTESLFADQRVGMRVQSIAGTSFAGVSTSSKLITTSVPEPGSLALLGIGLAGIGTVTGIRRRRQRKA